MTKKPTAPTRESLAIKAAIEASTMNQAQIAKHLGVDTTFVSHWVTAHRPVPAKLAVPLATLLNLRPEDVSAGYARIAASGSAQPQAKPAEELRPDLQIARLQNDIHALNLALGTITVMMVQHRPVEAKATAEAMRKAIPLKYRSRGLILELLTTLDRA